MDIGSTIKKLRKRASISREDFADACSISLSYLSMIENNKRKPHAETLGNICSALGITEPVLYMLSTDENDIPKEKLEQFNMIFPSMKAFMMELFSIDNLDENRS